MLAKWFSTLLPEGHAVLDVGCGDGIIDSLVLAQRPDVTIQGVDVLVRPQARIAVTPFQGSRLPFSDGAFDTVLFSDVLHHTETPDVLLKDAVRVARHGVLIKDHVVQGVFARSTLKWMDYVGNAPHGVSLPYRYLEQNQWDELFRECGIVPRVVVRRLGLYPRWADPWFGRSLHFVGFFDIVRVSTQRNA